MTLILKTLLFKSKKEEPLTSEPIEFDREKAVIDLQEMVRCKTISGGEESIEIDAEFDKFEGYIKKSFKNILANTEYTKVGNRGMLFYWKGKSPSKPSVLMSHFDVVPVDENSWTHPPFGGDIIDGVLWGRGTLDTKCTLNAVLQAVEYHIARGFVPENDIYLAFSGDEEISGEHAPKIVQILKEKGVSPDLVLDEGGAVVDKVFPGLTKPSALVGIAEKGYLDVKYTVKGDGGHSSTPGRNTPVTILAKACSRVNKKPFKMRLTKPAKEMFDILGRESKSFPIRLVFANFWLFKKLLGLATTFSGGEINALLRTTTAFTKMQGSDRGNVIPPLATMASNHRIMPGESVAEILEGVKKRVADDRVILEVETAREPSNISKTEGSKSYAILKETIRESFDNAIVSPYLMLGGTDSRHYDEICDQIYRFSPLRLTKEDRALIHGNNERISISTLKQSVEFYIRLVAKL